MARAWIGRHHPLGLLRAVDWLVSMIDVESVQPQIAPSDASLDAADIELTQNGDGDAYERIVRRHQQELARRLRRFARDRRTLEELVHETFVQAYLSLDRFRGDAPFSHWLHRIAVRVGYRYWKTRQREARVAPLLKEPAVESNDGPDTESAVSRARAAFAARPARRHAPVSRRAQRGRNGDAYRMEPDAGESAGISREVD